MIDGSYKLQVYIFNPVTPDKNKVPSPNSFSQSPGTDAPATNPEAITVATVME